MYDWSLLPPILARFSKVTPRVAGHGQDFDASLPSLSHIRQIRGSIHATFLAFSEKARGGSVRIHWGRQRT